MSPTYSSPCSTSAPAQALSLHSLASGLPPFGFRATHCPITRQHDVPTAGGAFTVRFHSRLTPLTISSRCSRFLSLTRRASGSVPDGLRHSSLAPSTTIATSRRTFTSRRLSSSALARSASRSISTSTFVGDEANTNPTRYETGEFAEDGAFDELAFLIAWLVQRIENTLGHGKFCGVDIFGVRADVAMLATIIGAHGGRHLIKRAKVKDWAQRINEPFTNESMRGFTGWPEEAWAEWRAGCAKTIQHLRDLWKIKDSQIFYSVTQAVVRILGEAAQLSTSSLLCTSGVSRPRPHRAVPRFNANPRRRSCLAWLGLLPFGL